MESLFLSSNEVTEHLKEGVPKKKICILNSRKVKTRKKLYWISRVVNTTDDPM